jgi:signal transduction histidine kinase
LAGQFDKVEFDFSSKAEKQAARLPGMLAEVIFYAAREALRNAAQHGRGEGPLHLIVKARWTASGGLSIAVIDDGVGFGKANAAVDLPKSGQGLILHSALVAVIGGQLTLEQPPKGGSAVHISLPSSTQLVK